MTTSIVIIAVAGGVALLVVAVALTVILVRRRRNKKRVTPGSEGFIYPTTTEVHQHGKASRHAKRHENYSVSAPLLFTTGRDSFNPYIEQSAPSHHNYLTASSSNQVYAAYPPPRPSARDHHGTGRRPEPLGLPGSFTPPHTIPYRDPFGTPPLSGQFSAGSRSSQSTPRQEHFPRSSDTLSQGAQIPSPRPQLTPLLIPGSPRLLPSPPRVETKRTQARSDSLVLDDASNQTQPLPSPSSQYSQPSAFVHEIPAASVDDAPPVPALPQQYQKPHYAATAAESPQYSAYPAVEISPALADETASPSQPTPSSAADSISDFLESHRLPDLLHPSPESSDHLQRSDTRAVAKLLHTRANRLSEAQKASLSRMDTQVSRIEREDSIRTVHVSNGEDDGDKSRNASRIRALQIKKRLERVPTEYTEDSPSTPSPKRTLDPWLKDYYLPPTASG